MCDNKTTYMRPKGYTYVQVKIKCGHTKPDGTTAICEACHEQAGRDYPQGWRNIPGDICRHGQYIGDPGGPDYLCGRCEDGE